MDAVSLFLVGIVAGTSLWLGYAWIPGRLAPAEALRRFATERSARVRGDGRLEPITVLGVVRGRPFTLTWQRPPGAGDVLLVGVDCAAAAPGPLAPVAHAEMGAPDTIAADAALVTRWVRPAPELFTSERLAAILEGMAELAEDLEATHPPDDDPE